MLTLAQLDRLVVILVAPRNPNNIGAAARAMSNFGYPHLRIVNAYEVSFQEARSAVGAADLLASARQYETLEEATADCTLVVGTTAVGHRELQHPLHRLEAAGTLIQSHLADADPTRASAPKAALLFGSEKTGLSNEALSHCHWLLRIPTRSEHISMNLGQAVALCLYELIRQAPEALPATQITPASAQALDRLMALLLEVLEASGYIKPDPDDTTRQKIRRLILRLSPSPDDAEILLGMLRQLQWKLRHNSDPT